MKRLMMMLPLGRKQEDDSSNWMMKHFPRCPSSSSGVARPAPGKFNMMRNDTDYCSHTSKILRLLGCLSGVLFVITFRDNPWESCRSLWPLAFQRKLKEEWRIFFKSIHPPDMSHFKYFPTMSICDLLTWKSHFSRVICRQGSSLRTYFFRLLVSLPGLFSHLARGKKTFESFLMSV